MFAASVYFCAHSGAMDKFTAGERGTVKRTKIVRRVTTYVDHGGYMKTVQEEMEVTDDEEVSKA